MPDLSVLEYNNTIYNVKDAKARTDIEILNQFNAHDLLGNINKANESNNGIGFTWSVDQKTCHVEGTTNGHAHNNFWSYTNGMPPGIEAGKTYDLYLEWTGEDTNNIIFHFYCKENADDDAALNSNLGECLFNNTYAGWYKVTIPAATTCMTIRIYVDGRSTQKTANGNIKVLLRNTDSNQDLLENFNTFVTNLDTYLVNELDSNITTKIDGTRRAGWNTTGGNSNSTTHNIAFTYSAAEDTFTVTGTRNSPSGSTSDAIFKNLYTTLQTHTLPQGLPLGETLFIKYSGDKVRLQIYWTRSNGTQTNQYITTDTLVKVPADLSSCTFRLVAAITNGQEINETVHYPLIYSRIPTSLIESKLEQTQKTLKVLIFGNSYSYSAFGYTPAIIHEVAPDLHLVMGLLYNSGETIAGHISKFGDNDNPPKPYTKYSEYDSNNGYWINTAGDATTTPMTGITAKDALDKYEWDIIIIQQASAFSSGYGDETLEITNLISNYINYPVYYMFNVSNAWGTNRLGNTWYFEYYNIPGSSISQTPKPEEENLSKSNNHFFMKIASTKEMMDRGYIVNDFIPCATAMQNLRNSISNADEIGTAGYFCDDDMGHAQNGIGVLVSGYLSAMKLLEYAHEKVKLFKININPTTDWTHNILKLDTWSAHGNCVGVTDENKLIAQRCALAALQNPFIITDVVNNNFIFPITAKSIDEMTDQSKCYLYTGNTITQNDVTYSFGKWYYYNKA